MCEKEPKKSIALRKDLEGETLEKFEVVKEDLGLTKATDVFTVLLNDAYKRVKGKNQ